MKLRAELLVASRRIVQREAYSDSTAVGDPDGDSAPPTRNLTESLRPIYLLQSERAAQRNCTAIASFRRGADGEVGERGEHPEETEVGAKEENHLALCSRTDHIEVMSRLLLPFLELSPQLQH